ncbi:MAG: oligosaccharide flippase family protein [Deltaproteobacteria bacterium]|nr:oligosaccharide flippase family protein [Deltaproteobacteria bacterium]
MKEDQGILRKGNLMLPLSRIYAPLANWKRLKGSFAGNILTVSTGIALGQGIAVAVAPVITRLYTPADFGVLEVYVALLDIFGVAVCWKYEGAILLPESDATAANVFGLCMAIIVVMTAFTGFLTWTFGDTLLGLIKAQVMAPYVWLLPLGIMGAGIYQALNFWGIRKKAFGTIAWTKISQNVGKAAAMIGFGSFGAGAVGLVAGAIIGHCSGSTRMAVFAWRKDREAFRFINVKRGLEVLKRYKKFPLFTLGAQFLNTLGLRIPYLLLAANYGLQVVGWFALAQWIIGTPLGLIGASVAQVYTGELTQQTRQSPEKIKRLFFKTLMMLFLSALSIVLLIIIVAPFVMHLFFGHQWHETGKYIQVLSFVFALQFIAYPLIGTVDYLNRQGLGLAREILRAILMIGAIPLAAFLKQPAIIAILFYGIASSTVYLFGLILSWYAIDRHSTQKQ